MQLFFRSCQLMPEIILSDIVTAIISADRSTNGKILAAENNRVITAMQMRIP